MKKGSINKIKYFLGYVLFKIGLIFPIIFNSNRYINLIKSLVPNIFLKQNYFVLDNKKLIYLEVPKAACTSIKWTFLPPDSEYKGNIHFIRPAPWRLIHKIRKKEEDYYIFSFVRNPFFRLVSFFENKYKKEKGIYNCIDLDLLPKLNFLGLKNVNSFEHLVDKILVIPPCFHDKHFSSQFNLISSNINKELNFVGKFENMNDQYKHIVEKFDLLPLKHHNKSKRTSDFDWRSFYNLVLVEKVYQLYKKDIESFEYEKEYEELKNYLNT